MAVKNSLSRTTEPKPRLGLAAFLNAENVLSNIDQAIGKESRQRFITSVISSVNTNPALQECTHQSILSAALLGEALKLSPSPQLGHYYMVPFNDKDNGKVAQFQLGYKGYIQLAIRSGQYKKLNVLAIKEGELVRFDPLNEEIEVNLIEDEEQREAAPTVGYYAMFEYVNGFRKAIYWSRHKMLTHADKYSAAFSKDGCMVNTRNGQKKKVSFADYEAGNFPASDAWMYSSFWYKDFDGMAYKTMLRQLISKWGIMSIDMIRAMDSDMAYIHEDGTNDYVENKEPYVIDVEIVEPEEKPKGDAKAALFGNQEAVKSE